MLQIVQYDEKYHQQWDDYVIAHPEATCYHLTAWKRAVERAYGHRSCYFIAESESADPRLRKIVGVLPLFHLRNFLFGNQLVSLPFCDYGGILADDENVVSALVQKSTDLSRNLNDATVEFRNTQSIWSDRLDTSSHKVRMVLELNGNSDNLWKNFSGKLRSQIRKPEKEGLICKIGRVELLDDFYKVFAFNMRDLGSPVHSKMLVKAVLEEFGESSKLQVVYKGNIPVAAGLIICFKDTVFVPWASTVREFNPLSPNMMLYWNFLKYAADNEFLKFDFGRSSPEEGTYKFKAAMGRHAEPTLLAIPVVKNGQHAPARPIGQGEIFVFGFALEKASAAPREYDGAAHPKTHFSVSLFSIRAWLMQTVVRAIARCGRVVVGCRTAFRIERHQTYIVTPRKPNTAMKITLVSGARPNYMKIAPIVWAIRMI